MKEENDRPRPPRPGFPPPPGDRNGPPPRFGEGFPPPPPPNGKKFPPPPPNGENYPPPRPPRFGRGPGPGAMIPGQKAKDFKGTVGKLVTALRPYLPQIIIAVVFALAGTVSTIAGPMISGTAVTELYNGANNGDIDFQKIGRILFSLGALYVVGAVFTFAQGWIMAGVTQKFCRRIRNEISEKINRMPMRYFESKTVGEVLSRITNDVDTMGMNLSMSVTQSIISACWFTGALVMMFIVSPLISLIALAIVPVSAVVVGTFFKVGQKYFKAQQKYLGEINGQIEESISGHSVVKLFNYEESALEKFGATNDELVKSGRLSQFISGLMQPAMMFISNAGYAATAILGGALAFGKVIAVGDITAVLMYVRHVTQPVTQFAQISNMMQSMTAAAERVFEFLEEEEEIEAPARKVLTNCEGAVSFEHIKFGYDPEKIIIRDFNAQIAKGKTIAIVGPTGAGKTTIVKLLTRFYDAAEGAIKIDGIDIKELSRANLRENIGMVLQDTWLFKGTIRENIRYGKLEATDQDVEDAARAARAHRFIKTSPGGYDMELNEDASNISQGQKQLLTIARAILTDKPILILDEATSNVDTRTEEQIQKAMNNLMRGRTSFVIAHRLSTIKDADLILVLKEGDIAEQGSHAELLEKGGFYAELYNSQFEL